MARGAFENARTLLVVFGVIALAGCGRKAKAPAETGTGGAAGSTAGAGAGGSTSTGTAGAGSGGAGATGTGSGGTGTPGTGTGGIGAGAGGAGGGRGGATGAAGTTGAGGTGGSGGTGGAGASGTAGAGASGTGGSGAGGVSGTSGAAGTAGTGGSTGTIGCTIASAYAPSTAIPTVAIVTFATNLPGITAAQIRFGLASTGPTMTAPVDLTEPNYRTLLLGMKASSNYVYRIVLTAGAGTCTSQDFPVLTGPLPSTAVPLAMTIMNAAAHARGFIVGVYRGTSQVFIFDSDGDPVWWASGRRFVSRAHMGWDGKDMYVVAENANNNQNVDNVSRISMDHTNVEHDLSGLRAAHHDLTAIPGGIATLLWNRTGMDAPNAIVERSKDGTLTTVVADLATVYNATTFHPSSIHYYAADDSYTIGDTNPSLYVKITRQGQLVWQLGGSSPKDPSKFFQVEPPWLHNHGHQLLADGMFLLFSGSNGSAEKALALKLDPASMIASPVLSYAPTNGAISFVLGDVQRLPNGNILVTYAYSGEFHEITPSGELVAVLRTVPRGSMVLGYSEFRETLYGPPPY